MATSRPVPPLPREPPPPPKRAKTRSSPRATLTWSVLSPELVGRVGLFVDIGSDLTSLCLVAGRGVSRNVRTTFLRNNDDYLRCAIAKDAETRDTSRAVAKVRSWMEVNTDWAKRCGPPLHAEKYFCSVQMTPEAALRLMLQKMNLGHRLEYLGYRGIDREGIAARIKVGSILLSIGGVPIDSSSPVDSIINNSETSDDGTIRLQFLRDPVIFLFTDPKFVVQFGPSEILEVLFEKRFICVNDVFQGGGSAGAFSLLYYALIYNKPTFNYLLSRHDIDVCAEYRHNAVNLFGVLHQAARSARIPAKYLQALLQHPTANVNIICSEGRTPLHSLCCAITSDDARITKLRLLLEFGSDPHVQDSSGSTAIDYLSARIEREENQSVKAHLHELLSILLEETHSSTGD